MKLMLYKLALINKHRYIIQELYVVASGMNEAKRTLRESSTYYKGLNLKVVECSDVLISQPKEPKENYQKSFKRYDDAWKSIWD